MQIKIRQTNKEAANSIRSHFKRGVQPSSSSLLQLNTVITCKGAAPLVLSLGSRVGLTESGHSNITGGDL